jgi:uncharacterized protein
LIIKKLKKKDNKMKNIKLASFPFTFLFIASCVTINVYFPAAAAQEAAHKIVNEVLKQDTNNNQPDSQQQPDNKKEIQPDTSLHHSNYQQNIASYFIDLIIPSAYAGANMSINTAKIRSIRNQLKQQHNKLVPFFNKGNIGYSDEGLIRIRHTNGLNIKQKSTLKKQLNTNNATLSSLYTEIAKANAHPEWKADIQKTFAKTWISQMQGGWMYFSAGQWKKK